MKWKLELLDETKKVEEQFYEIYCKLIRSNTGTEYPAKLSFSPYLGVHEINGYLFGFKECCIYTSLNKIEQNADIHFNEIYGNNVECQDATIKKCGSKNQGHWIISSSKYPLNGDYPFHDDTVKIDFEGTEFRFDVEYRINRFSSSVSHHDGSRITKKNKKEILKMLLGDKIAKENGGIPGDLPLVKKHYLLSRENPYEEKP